MPAQKKLPKKTELPSKKTAPSAPEKESAPSAGTKIGILGWNSPRSPELYRHFIEAVKHAVVQHGGNPVFLGLSGGSDSLPFFCNMDHNGPHGGSELLPTGVSADALPNYGIPSRDLIADQIELVVQEERLHGVVLLPWSTNSMVGMMMGTSRCGLPIMFLPFYRGWSALCQKTEEVSYSKFPMPVLIEAMGLTKIGTLRQFSTHVMEDLHKKRPEVQEAPALLPDEAQLADWGGRRVVEMTKQKISSKRFFSQTSFHNAMCVDMALGGSEEAVLHLAAIAHEAGIPLYPPFFNEGSAKNPHIVSMNKSGEITLEEFEKEGGLLPLLSVVQNSLQASPTVMGKNIVEIAKEGSSSRSSFKLGHLHKKSGGLGVLLGNLAREGAVFRVAGIKEQWLHGSGPARVFETEQQCIESIMNGKVKKGEVLVIRYRGPKGCPGMPVMHSLKGALEKKELEESVVILTDGRAALSGKTPAFTHAAPEAAVGSTLAVLQDNDMIHWNFAEKTISVRLTDTEVKVRLSRWKEQEKNMKNSYLNRYSKHATSCAIGAVIS